MMNRIWLLLLGFVLFLGGACHADGFEASLNAGATSVHGGVHYTKDVNSGYVKAGISGLYTEDDDMEYRWGEVRFVVGSGNLQPGLTVEAGLKGIYGEAEDGPYAGDVGAVAFNGRVNYLFPRRTMPIPLEVFGAVNYAPEMLSFEDTETYLSYHLGVGLRIVQNASIVLEYSGYDVEMESGPGDWTLDDDVIRLGVIMRF